MAPAANGGINGLEALLAEFKGSVLRPQDGTPFQQSLQVWAVSPAHGKLPPVPALVVQPRGTRDVAAAVKWAGAHGMEVAVKSGGHGMGNPSCVEGGMMIDLSLMRSVSVDPQAKTAVADGGCLLCDVDAETSLYGLHAPLGVCSVVGMGLAVNGGLSLLSRTYGATCDNILEATLVLADGSVVHVNPESDPELYWAVRGAGSTLGVVTKIKLRLYDMTGVFTGAFVWPEDPEHKNYRAVLHWIRDVVLPDTSIGFNLARVTDPQHGPLLVSMVVMLGEGSDEEKAELLRPLRALGPIVDTVGKSSFLQTQKTNEAGVMAVTQAFPVHYEAVAGGHLTTDRFNEEFISDLVRCTTDEVPMPDCALTLMFIELAGGRLKDSQAPFGLKAGDMQWVVQAGWSDPASLEKGLGFARLLRESLGKHTNEMESYVNMLDCVNGPELSYREAAAKVGGAESLERLRAAKTKYDPGNMFSRTPFSRVLAAKAP